MFATLQIGRRWVRSTTYGRAGGTYTFWVGFLPYFSAIGFLLGLLFGSFLNVCIARVPRGESVVRPESRCMRCGHAVRWFDNVPLVSWLVLRGRCRDCGERISWQYPAVELAVGVWVVAVVWSLSPDALGFFGDVPSILLFPQALIHTIAFLVLGFLLIGLMVIDWQTLRLPDVFTLGGVAAGMFLVCLQAAFLAPGEDQVVLNPTHQLRLSSPGSFAARGNVFLTGPEALIFGRLAAICGAALLLLAVRWAYRAMRKRDGLGLGDVKMLAMVAAFLGFWPAVLTLFLGVMLASLYGIWLLVRGRAGALTRLPLGSFLGAGGLVAAVFGPAILGWYRGLL
jgi:leader peptidase (prepilin peptidase)/N-methyltransferase